MKNSFLVEISTPVMPLTMLSIIAFVVVMFSI